MGEQTGIAWTDHTYNPWQGCHKVSEGCLNCYMYRDKKRYGQNPTTVVRSSPTTFNAPLGWERAWLAREKVSGGIAPKLDLVFLASWSDFFIEEADEWRAEVWKIIRQTPHIIYQILTKRPENILARLPEDWGAGWPNVWLGVTAENQARADERIPILLQVPAAVRFVSAEPLLGPISFWPWLSSPSVAAMYSRELPLLDLVIAGGETGPNARPMDPAWARSIRDQCKAGVPFFFKQMAARAPIPDDLMIREFPEVPNARR